MLTSSQSFEPRVGTAQLVFCIIYFLTCLISVTAAAYAYSVNPNELPGLQIFMSFLTFILALKSYVIYVKVKTLMKNGVMTKAKLISCEAVRGITILKGEIDVKDYGTIIIESKLAGSSIADEINQYLQTNKQEYVPAMIVGADIGKPRGLITIKSKSGRLDIDSIKIQTEE